MRRHNFWAAAVVRAFLALPAAAAGPTAARPADGTLLRAAGVAADGSNLLDFFRRRSPSAAERARVAALVRRLGDDDFAARQQASADLGRAGPAALPALRGALRDPDPEVRERAANVLSGLGVGRWSETSRAAIRMLRSRAPAGAAAALVAWLPDAEDEAAEEEAVYGLAAVGVRRGAVDGAVAAATDDPRPARRAAAGLVLGRSGDAAGRAAARALLADSDPRVRFRAAERLLAGRDPAALPALAAALTDGPDELAARPEELLRCLGNGRGPPGPLPTAGDLAGRLRYRKAWEAWGATAGRALVARGDVDLPPYNPALRAASTVRRFSDAAFGGDAAAATRFCGFPFQVAGEMTFKTAEEMKPLLAQAGLIEKRPSLRFVAGPRLEEVRAAAGPIEKRFLAAFRPADVRVVEVRLSGPGYGGPGDDGVAVLVALAGNDCRIRGFFPRTEPVRMAR